MRRQVALGDMRQHQVLLVADADFAERIALGEIGDASIWSAVASPGGPPTGFSDILTIA
jgi:hypothetical protein